MTPVAQVGEEAGRSVLRGGVGIHHRYSTGIATGLQRDELHRPDDVAERHLRDPKSIRYSGGTGSKGICGSGSVHPLRIPDERTACRIPGDARQAVAQSPR